MNLLIVYTHPSQQSLCYAFFQKVIEGSKENENIHHIKTVDLYHENFNPTLTFNQNKKRRNMYCDPEFEKYRRQISWADKIVFIYPIWWGRPPAMLLGYFDQIFSSNFAYKEVGRLLPEGLLKNKSVICISTMKGPTHYPLFLLNNAHKKLMKKAVFSFVGIKKVKLFEFGGMEKSNGKQKKNLRKIYNYMSKIRA